MKIYQTFIWFLACILMVSCAHRQTSHYFGSYSTAEKYFNDQEYEKAIDSYEEYIEENPEGNMMVIAKFYVARSYAELGDTPEAEKRFLSIIENHPDTPWADFSRDKLKVLGQ